MEYRGGWAGLRNTQVVMSKEALGDFGLVIFVKEIKMTHKMVKMWTIHNPFTPPLGSNPIPTWRSASDQTSLLIIDSFPSHTPSTNSKYPSSIYLIKHLSPTPPTHHTTHPIIPIHDLTIYPFILHDQIDQRSRFLCFEFGPFD